MALFTKEREIKLSRGGETPRDIYINGELFLVFMYSVKKQALGYHTINHYYHQPNNKELIHIKTEFISYH
jgi:hypothetical protein